MAFIFSESQTSAFEIAKSGHNLLLTGAAGTGKSFIVKKITEDCTKRSLNCCLTCTTGISCSVYGAEYKASTIHRWSGIGDGRYSAQELKNLILNHVKYVDTLQRIKTCDVLIIDECSMLSKRLLEILEVVCSIKNEGIMFGGIQVIICGDFLQLPPVPNTAFNEDGAFCFESQLFSKCFSHKVILKNIIRQNEDRLIKAIHEVSCGSPTEETNTFLKTLARPLEENFEFVPKLFSNNEMVDDFNRDSIINIPGQMNEYLSEDTGESKNLNSILAPKTLWLKICCPVMLIRNLSDELVNGLLGVVYDLQKDAPILVEFPSLGKIIPIEKIPFTVYNPRKGTDVAVRVQYPLKLAFGMTIHKSQGMTLNRVEIDCRGIFKPGQQGVALGRVRASDGVRVINYDAKYCIKQPEKVMGVIENTASAELHDDRSCCRNILRDDQTEVPMGTTEFISDTLDVTDEEFDEDFNYVIASLCDDDSSLLTVQLPQEVECQSILNSIVEQKVITPAQTETNTAIKNINHGRFEKFTKQMYIKILSILKENIHDNKTDLGKFYIGLKIYYNSLDYKMKSLDLFTNEPFSNVHMHICYRVTVFIRTFVLRMRANEVESISQSLHNRTVTLESQARIRYVAGYCVRKLQKKFKKKKNSSRHLLDKKGDFQEAKSVCLVLDGLLIEEQELLETTRYKDSLIDVTRRQNINRGLINISDCLFEWFIRVTEKCLSLLVDENLTKEGSNIFQFCLSEIMKADLYKQFVSICFEKRVENLVDENSVESVLEEMVLSASAVSVLYSSLLELHLMTLLNQFRKDLIEKFAIEKKMAHRKQVRVASSKSKSKHKSDIHVDSQSLLASSSQPESESNSEDKICKLCDSHNKKNEWIFCGSCSNWLHRDCAGLKHHMKWKKYQKKGSAFLCIECG